MKIFVENIRQQEEKKTGDLYYTFWVLFMFPAPSKEYISVSGFRYWPATRKLSTPSVSKGGKFHNTSKIHFDTFNKIAIKIEQALDVYQEQLRTAPQPIGFEEAA